MHVEVFGDRSVDLGQELLELDAAATAPTNARRSRLGWKSTTPLTFDVHYTTTYSSWINQVERLFAYTTADLLQHPDRRSVQALEADIQACNENPKPFIWTKTAESILKKLGRLLRIS